MQIVLTPTNFELTALTVMSAGRQGHLMLSLFSVHLLASFLCDLVGPDHSLISVLVHERHSTTASRFPFFSFPQSVGDFREPILRTTLPYVAPSLPCTYCTFPPVLPHPQMSKTRRRASTPSLLPST